MHNLIFYLVQKMKRVRETSFDVQTLKKSRPTKTGVVCHSQTIAPNCERLPLSYKEKYPTERWYDTEIECNHDCKTAIPSSLFEHIANFSDIQDISRASASHAPLETSFQTALKLPLIERLMYLYLGGDKVAVADFIQTRDLSRFVMSQFLKEILKRDKPTMLDALIVDQLLKKYPDRFDNRLFQQLSDFFSKSYSREDQDLLYRIQEKALVFPSQDYFKRPNTDMVVSYRVLLMTKYAEEMKQPHNQETFFEAIKRNPCQYYSENKQTSDKDDDLEMARFHWVHYYLEYMGELRNISQARKVLEKYFESLPLSPDLRQRWKFSILNDVAQKHLLWLNLGRQGPRSVMDENLIETWLEYMRANSSEKPCSYPYKYESVMFRHSRLAPEIWQLYRDRNVEP